MNQERRFKGVWIPREIWLSQELTMQEKIFLVEIDSLDNENGCFASNGYFADFFQVSKGRVSQVIKGLEDKDLISIKYEYRAGTKEIDRRIIHIKSSAKTLLVGVKETKGPPLENYTGYLENAKGNNTLSNNTDNIIGERNFSLPVSFAVSEWLEYKKEKNQSYKPTGLKSFLTQVENQTREYGDQAVIDVIGESMASNYQGVTWDKLKKMKPKQTHVNEMADAFQEMIERGDFN